MGLPFFLALLLPIVVFLIFNIVAYVLILRSLMTTQPLVTSDHSVSRKTQLRRACAISVLVGVTWLFGALAVRDAKLVFQYVFCILNSFQGFFIFVFYCLFQETIRRRWWFFLRNKNVNERYVTKTRSTDPSELKPMKKLEDTNGN